MIEFLFQDTGSFKCVYFAKDSPFSSFLMSCVEEWPWWPIQSPNKGKKQKAERRERSDQVYSSYI